MTALSVGSKELLMLLYTTYPCHLERSGALQDVGESVERLLPEDERTKRQKGERKAKWAININVIANILLLAAKAVAAGYSSSLSLIASLVDSGLDLLCTVIVWTTNRLVSWRLNSLRRRFPVRFENGSILEFENLRIEGSEKLLC